ncbi:MAG: hypothetical protein M0Z58_02400 [Nitrospiraceae bacterium]|nr:hypothetical protein [Nitrospiraceae bacterium]
MKVFLDHNTAAGLAAMEMDFVEEKEGSGFVLKGQPQSSSGCSSCNH